MVLRHKPVCIYITTRGFSVCHALQLAWPSHMYSCHNLINKNLHFVTVMTCEKIVLDSKRLTLKCTDNSLAVGTICVFECEDGYFVVGDGDSECIASKDKTKGEWSGTVPRCESEYFICFTILYNHSYECTYVNVMIPLVLT